METIPAPLAGDAYNAGRPVPDPALAEAGVPRSAGDGMDRLQLFGEVLRVHKERIHRGAVKIHKDVFTEEQTIEVPVTREELLLERVPIEAGTPAPSASIGNAQEIRVLLSEEKVRIEKEPVLREEFIVGKRDVSEVESVTGTVRHEELRVDSDGEHTPTGRGWGRPSRRKTPARMTGKTVKLTLLPIVPMQPAGTIGQPYCWTCVQLARHTTL